MIIDWHKYHKLAAETALKEDQLMHACTYKQTVYVCVCVCVFKYAFGYQLLGYFSEKIAIYSCSASKVS